MFQHIGCAIFPTHQFAQLVLFFCPPSQCHATWSCCDCPLVLPYSGWRLRWQLKKSQLCYYVDYYRKLTQYNNEVAKKNDGYVKMSKIRTNKDGPVRIDTCVRAAYVSVRRTGTCGATFIYMNLKLLHLLTLLRYLVLRKMSDFFRCSYTYLLSQKRDTVHSICVSYFIIYLCLDHI